MNEDDGTGSHKRGPSEGELRRAGHSGEIFNYIKM